MNDQTQIIVEEKIIKLNGDICNKKYLRGKFLGKGGFAKCYQFINIDTQRVLAAKIIAKSSLTKSRANKSSWAKLKFIEVSIIRMLLDSSIFLRI